jgi:hypothetical protein
MTVLPEPTPTAPAAGQAHRNTAIQQQADQMLAALAEISAQQPTSFRDDSPLPSVGTTPPVTQPGRPPMSSKAVDDAARMLSASVVIAVTGGSTTAVLWASGYANPTVVALVFGAPTALVLALGRLAKRAKGVLPEEHHHHYSGPVDQRTTHSSTRGVWAKNINEK